MYTLYLFIVIIITMNKLVRYIQLRARLSYTLGNLEIYLDNYNASDKYLKMFSRKLHKFKQDLEVLKKLNASISLKLYGALWLSWRMRCIIFNFGYPNLEHMLKFVGIANLRDNVSQYFDIFVPINIQRTNYKTNSEGKVEVSLEPLKPSLQNFYGKLYGACLMIRTDSGTIRIIGHTKRDLHRNIRNDIDMTELKTLLLEKDKDVQWDNYIYTMNVRDHLVTDVKKKAIEIHRNYKKIDAYKEMSMEAIINEYTFCNGYQRYELIKLLLCGNMIDMALNLLSTSNKLIMENLDWEFQNMLPEIMRMKVPVSDNKNIEEIPYDVRINELDVSDKVKKKAFEKLKQIIRSKGGDGAPKATKWLDNFLSIPFGKLKKEEGLQNHIEEYKEEFKKDNPELSMDDVTHEKVIEINEKIMKERNKHSQYIQNAKHILDTGFHGHPKLKKQLRRYLAQLITGGENGMVIGIHGPPGNGKTTAIKQGFAKCFVDENGVTRPVEFISLSGANRASRLRGHNYTYLGSTYGRIVSALIDAECMNPILLFDEVDKCSVEIQQILIQLTDPSQNKEFNDNYFEGIPIDISKCLIIFTFNDISKIDNVLLDRIKPLIETEALTTKDKLAISKQHLLPEIAGFVGMEYNDIKISDNQIINLIDNYTMEAGARQLRQLLIDVIRELNYGKLLDPELKLCVTDELISEVFQDRTKVQYTKIPEHPVVGQINGMWANSLGLGGILYIQVKKMGSKEGKLELTGRQGDTMQESMRCSRTCATTMAKEYFGKIGDDITFENTGFAIHIPFTGGGVDGPSAGGAICLAIYSELTSLPIMNNVSMTGTCDLRGNLGRIGGLGKKLLGAVRAGVQTVIISKENHDDLVLLRKKELSQEDKGLKIVEIGHVQDALKYFFKV